MGAGLNVRGFAERKAPSLAKITRPRASGVVLRKRLFRMLDNGIKKPVVWVSAPAGSGKTTLVSSGGKTSTCMFDYGINPVGVLNNIALLGLDIGKANAFSLSHGHYDHYSGAVSILKQNQSRIAGGMPFDRR